MSESTDPMVQNTHLVLHETTVPTAGEWSPRVQGLVFLRVLQGDGYLLRPSSTQALNVGDMLVATRATPCPLRASQLGELRIQYFQLCPDLLGGTLSPFERQHLEAAIGHNNGQSLRYFSAAHPSAQQFASLTGQARGGDSMMVRFQMLQLAAPILKEELPQQPPKPSNGQTAKDRFDELMQRTPETKLHDYAVFELAQLCCCSVRHFSRLYKAAFGRSFGSKRIELRLQKAQQLLAETDDKIIDVAMESGFQQWDCSPRCSRNASA